MTADIPFYFERFQFGRHQYHFTTAGRWRSQFL